MAESLHRFKANLKAYKLRFIYCINKELLLVTIVHVSERNDFDYDKYLNSVD